jgi:hypothetical protein
MHYTNSSAAKVLGAILFAGTAWAQINPCDLAPPYGTIDRADVDAAITMTLNAAINPSACTANIAGTGVCNAVVVQRVINASMGGACVTGYGAVPHAATLTWTASSNATGYNVYRGTTPGGPYSKINSTLVVATTYMDTTALAGVTYVYVVTAIDSSNVETGYSNQAQGTIPTP